MSPEILVVKEERGLGAGFPQQNGWTLNGRRLRGRRLGGLCRLRALSVGGKGGNYIFPPLSFALRVPELGQWIPGD